LKQNRGCATVQNILKSGTPVAGCLMSLS
jgi:hypothetical protein